jgi:hypothetical protein
MLSRMPITLKSMASGSDPYFVTVTSPGGGMRRHVTIRVVLGTIGVLR